MEVSISAYYEDTTRDIREQHSITLTDVDGYNILGDKWTSLDVGSKVEKLYAYADIFLISQGVKKGLRYEESASQQIRTIIERELRD